MPDQILKLQLEFYKVKMLRDYKHIFNSHRMSLVQYNSIYSNILGLMQLDCDQPSLGMNECVYCQSSLLPARMLLRPVIQVSRTFHLPRGIPIPNHSCSLD